MDATSLLMAGGLHVGGMTIPWSVIVLLVIIVVGLLLIRTAITLVKVAILVAIGIAVFLAIRFLFNEFA